MAEHYEHYRIIELAGIGDVERLKTLLRHHIRSWQPIFTDAILNASRDAREASLAP
jgi:DNA-binding GntR family transcriptional regulator